MGEVIWKPWVLADGEQKQIRVVVLLIVYLLSPLASAILSLIYYDKRNTTLILSLFTAYYGYCIIGSDEMDLVRYKDLLSTFQSVSWSDYWALLIGEKTEIEGFTMTEPYLGFIGMILSRFTLNGDLLVSVLGFFYGLFFSLSLSCFLEESNERLDLWALFPLLAFVALYGLNSLGGARFSTAVYLLFYGAVRFIKHPSVGNFAIAAMSVLVHFGMAFGVILLLAHLFLKRAPWLCYGIFGASFFFRGSLSQFKQVFADSANSALSAKVEDYTSDTAAMNRDQMLASSKWFVFFDVYMHRLFSEIVSVVVVFSQTMKVTSWEKGVFLFFILLASFSNLAIDIPSLGARYLFVSMQYFYFFLFLLYLRNKKEKVVRAIALFSLVASSLTLALSVRGSLIQTPWSMVTGNWFTVTMMPAEDRPIYDAQASVEDLYFNDKR